MSHVTIPAKWLNELLALCGPEDHELRERVMKLAAPAAPSTEGMQARHDRDSAELRRLCQARDEARRERDLARVEIAGLEASTLHLSRLVDELRPRAERYDYLRNRDLNAIHRGGVFAGMTPDNVVLNGDDLDAAIDGALAAQAAAKGAA